jgi:hypothetical protein
MNGSALDGRGDVERTGGQLYCRAELYAHSCNEA